MSRAIARVCVVVGIAMALTLPGAAMAHHPDPATDCDTLIREGHEAGHHHQYPDNDREVGPAYVHNHGGHYYVRADGSGYVEVIGGQGYNHEGSQGGAVQGGVDGPNGRVTFYFHTFAPSGKTRVCVSGAGEKVDVDQGPL